MGLLMNREEERKTLMLELAGSPIECLRVATEEKYPSITFPSNPVGVYGWMDGWMDVPRAGLRVQTMD